MTRRYLTAHAYRQVATQLVERDIAVIQHVSELRFVSGAQLTRLCFAEADDPATNARVARRALARLVRLGLLERLPRQVGGVRSGSAGYVYHLGIGGQRLAIERGWQPERRRRRSTAVGTLFVRHALEVAELHTLLTERDRSRSVELLELAAEPCCWRNYDGIGGQRATLKPDSYVRLGVGDYEHRYFIEVDRGTEGSRALERQLQAYIAYYRSGSEQAAHDVFPRVLWLAPDDRRVGVIASCVERQAEPELFAVARFDQALVALSGDLADL
jgi:Replication-relaxation